MIGEYREYHYKKDPKIFGNLGMFPGVGIHFPNHHPFHYSYFITQLMPLVPVMKFGIQDAKLSNVIPYFKMMGNEIGKVPQ